MAVSFDDLITTSPTAQPVAKTTTPVTPSKAVSFDDLLTTTPKQTTTTTSPNVKKYLDVLGEAEGAGYNTIVGGTTFDDYSKHPGVVGVRTKEGPSTAAGKYQITKTTYDDVAKKLGITDFSPESQDRIALELIRRNGALEDLEAGNYDAATKKLGKTWASLPSSTYSQPKRSEEWLQSKLKTGAETFVKGKDMFADLLAPDTSKPEEPKMNWAGTGPEMPFGEYMKSGFAGRFVSGAVRSDDVLMKQADDTIVSQYGKDIKNNPKKYKELWNKEYSTLKTQEATRIEEEKKANPEPTFTESLKGFGSELINNPGRAVAGLIYELGKDPELLGIGALAAPKILGAAATGPKIIGNVASAGKAAKAVQSIGAVTTSAVKAGALGVGLETAAEIGDQTGLDLQKIANTGGMFATFGGVTHGLGEVYKGVKGTPKPKAEPSPVDFETELGKFESMSNTTKSSDVGTGLASDIEEAGRTLSTSPYIGNKSETGLPIKQGPILDSTTGEPLFDGSNRPRMAVMRRDKITGEPIGIELNLEEIGKRFEEKPWVKLGHPEDTFKTPEQYARFILKHEEEHVLQSFDEWKATRPVELGEATEKDLRFQYETDINKRAKVKLDAEIEKELKDNPSLYELGDIFKDDTYTERTGLNAVHRVLADLSLNKRAARFVKESIERMIPNKQIRERITMAIEGEKETDRLLTDEAKRQLLEGDTLEVIEAKEARGEKPETGLISRLKFYNLVRNYLNYGGGALHPKAFETFWKNFTRKNGIETKTVEEQIAYFMDKRDKLNFTVNKLKELPSEENAIKLQKVIEGKFAELGEIAKKEGVLDNLRQNYVAHVIDFSDSVLSKENQRSLLDRLNLEPKESRLNRDFSEARMYRYIRDLEKRVYEVANEMGLDTTGLKVQRDIARIYEVYHESMGNAIIQKRLTNFLADKVAIQIPVIGRNGQVTSITNLGILTKDYKLAFENKYKKFTGYGSEALKDYMVHPDIIPALGHLFRQTDPNLVLRGASAISMLSKTITTMASMFHATSLAWARMGATPFGMLKEIGTGFSGTRAALETLRHDGHSEAVDNWTKAGLKFETEDIQQGILPQVGKSVDNFVTKMFSGKDIKLTRQIIDPLETQVLQKINALTWDFMHSAGKFDVAQTIFANMKAKNPMMADQAIYNEVSAFVNNTFGGLDWLKVADEVQNKTLKNLAISMTGLQGRTWMQVLMFAPDWTISTLRSYSKALPKELFRPDRWEVKKGAQGLINPTTSGDLARRYVLTTGVLYLTLINGINMAITGRPVWTNKDPTRIDLGDGTTMQLAKHSMEGPHWLLHPIKTGVNKLGYIPKTLVTLASPYVNTPMDALKVMAEPFVPFQISAAANAPSGEKLKRGAFSFLGFPIYGQTDRQNTSVDILAERKEKRKETMIKNKEEKIKRQ